ncbi:anti-sigma factor domain-containing protein [Clostridium lundense]|uniref:anti-sigma factor domain-containing protein n=1 Tax=Clostridium lundense TaxID=319475 RepID=UPI000A6A5D55|nr:hypothetical protein [Clostridium lundense]
MANKKGIVMEVANKEVYILSNNGEFHKLRLKGRKPNIGEEYFGEEINERGIFNYFNKVAVAACLTFTIFSSTAAYAYYKPVSTVLLTGSSAIELKSNRFNRVISAKSLDNKGTNLLDKVKINNKLVDDALVEILNEIPKSNDETMDLKVTGKNIKVDKFKNSIVNNNLRVKVTQNDKIEEVIGEEKKNSKINIHEQPNSNIKKNNDNKNDNQNSNGNKKNVNPIISNKSTNNKTNNNGITNKQHNNTKEDINNKNYLNKSNKDNKGKGNEMKNEKNRK